MPTFLFVCISVGLTARSQAADWKVGISKVVITPKIPVPLVGYGNRSDPFTGIDIDIYAKALALEDSRGRRAVLVTADLVGFSDVFFRPVCERVMQETKLSRAQIILNASHNHTGPLISLKPNLQGNVGYSTFSKDQARRVVDYTKGLQEQIYRLILAALADLEPATMSWGADRVSFVMNRRLKTWDGTIRMSPNPAGPIDPIVPVLKVTGANGKLRAILFGCACHNTGLTGDHNIISGDYAGYAQEILEKRYLGAIALFLAGCGADANPEPRTDIRGVRIHGLELADAVTRALESKLKPIHGDLNCALRMTDLPLKTFGRSRLQAMAAESDVVGLMSKQMWKLFQSGATLRTNYPAPIAAWSLGDDLTIVALPSETVAEYALNLRAENPTEPLWVSGYNNDFFGYVPTAQIVREGGHEAIGVTTWLWGTDLADHVGFFREDVEDAMMKTARELLKDLKTVSVRGKQSSRE